MGLFNRPSRLEATRIQLEDEQFKRTELARANRSLNDRAQRAEAENVRLKVVVLAAQELRKGQTDLTSGYRFHNPSYHLNLTYSRERAIKELCRALERLEGDTDAADAADRT